MRFFSSTQLCVECCLCCVVAKSRKGQPINKCTLDSQYEILFWFMLFAFIYLFFDHRQFPFCLCGKLWWIHTYIFVVWFKLLLHFFSLVNNILYPCIFEKFPINLEKPRVLSVPFDLFRHINSYGQNKTENFENKKFLVRRGFLRALRNVASTCLSNNLWANQLRWFRPKQ